MAQYARPSADVAAGSWDGVPGPELFSALNEEVADDTTLIQCSPTANDSCEIRLDEVTPGLINRGHILRYRASKGTAGGNSRGLTVDLLQGSTVIATNDHPDLSAIWLPGAITLTPEQGALITDYADLRVRFTATGVVSGTAIQRRRVQVSWVQFRVPDWQPTWDNDWGAVEDTSTPEVWRYTLDGVTGEGPTREDALVDLWEKHRSADAEIDIPNPVHDRRWNMAYYTRKQRDYRAYRERIENDTEPVPAHMTKAEMLAEVDRKMGNFDRLTAEADAEDRK
jgi:hypothetical protein